MLKIIALIAFVVLLGHKLLATAGTLQTANTRAALALVFIVLLLAVIKQEFGEFLTPPSRT